MSVHSSEAPCPHESGTSLNCTRISSLFICFHVSMVCAQEAAPLWNLRGVLNNAWHRVTLRWGVEDEEAKENPEGLRTESI